MVERELLCSIVLAVCPMLLLVKDPTFTFLGFRYVKFILVYFILEPRVV